MSNDILNTIILVVLLAGTAGGGYYVTQKQQPERLAEIEADIEAIESRDAEIETLIAQEAQASQEAAETLTRWNTRYKVLPAELSSAEVISYLNALSARGFERFDLSLTGITPGETASHYTYQATGSAYFESLFSFIWYLENSRGMYRVRDLSVSKNVTLLGASGVERQVVLADFAMAIDAFYSTNADISAPDSAVVPPPEAFPPRRAAVNPFFPYVFDDLPPNSDNLVDVDQDRLVSVIGGLSVFERDGALRQLRAGDRVYLGRVASVDPARGKVTIDLNKGGIRERVELDLETGERYRQHIGRATVLPTTRGALPAGPVLESAPPAPGTPEAEAAGTYDSAPIDG
ncbi:MAG: ABC transporter C-terminal domain-containing protein [Bacteroidota bacterium]